MATSRPIEALFASLNNRMRASLLSLLALVGLGGLAEADTAYTFASPDAERDAIVTQCLQTDGVSYFDDTKTVCYNAPIFPEQFLKLNEFPDADQIVITSPGGNVATARLMSTILDNRGEPAIIAGQCMSACAMVLLPGLDQFHIHRTAHIAVHGITTMDYRTWYGWLREDAEPGAIQLMAAQLGYDFNFIMHKSGQDHMQEHLDGQAVDFEYINTVSSRMQTAAEKYDCRVDPKDYWGMLDAEHIQTFLGDRVTGMEAFAQNWSDPANTVYRNITVPISDQTYIFKNDHAPACD
ncbi:MAG: hypothetical protein AAGJ84_03540 [Pseudomonadota bacterium]